MPVPAVIAGGRPTVSSGSRITCAGSILGWKITFLVWVARLVMTPARPTSEPVPAVVGTATIGAMPAGSARVHQSPTSSKSHIGRVWPRMKATTLPAVERRAAAEGDDAVVAAVAQRREAGGDVRLGRVRLHVGEDRGVAGRRRRSTPSARAVIGSVDEAGVGDEERPGDAGARRRRRPSSSMRPAPKRIAVG